MMNTKANNMLKQGALQRFYTNNKKVLIALIMIVVVFVAGEVILVNFFGAESGSFLSVQQFLVTAKLAAYVALFGLCQMIVIAGGGSGLDLSIGYIATLAAILSTRIMNGSDAGILPSILVAIAIGLAFGIANGLLVSYLKMPALIATMAMSYIIQGIVNAYSTDMSITGTPAPAIKSLAAKSTGAFPNILFVIIIAAIVVQLIITKTRLGTLLLGVGANEHAARLSGIDVKRVRCITYIVSGMIAGVTGILLAGNAGQAYKDMGSSYLMPSVVAVVVGGISIDGGEANYIGVILGAIVLQSLTSLFITFGWGDGGKFTGYGIILFLMLSAYVRSKRSR